MGVVAAHVYGDGKRLRLIDLDSIDQLVMAPGEFAWIGVSGSDEAVLRALQKRFDLHPLAVEDALNARQLPKIEVYGPKLFLVARTAHLDNEILSYGETYIFVGADHIITVRHGSARAHVGLREQTEAVPARLALGVDYVLHAVLDFIVDGYFPIMEAIEEEVLAMEREALDAFLTKESVMRIFNLRRELMRFRRVLAPMEEVASRLVHHELPCIDDNVRHYFWAVRDHVRRVAAEVDTLRDVLSSVFEASTLLEQQRQGTITRQLAAWAAILAVPTAIAGIYGMNFEFMPELHWKYGYFVVIGVIGSACAFLYSRFKYYKWL